MWTELCSSSCRVWTISTDINKPKSFWKNTVRGWNPASSFLSPPLTAGCRGAQAAAGPQSKAVSREPISVVQRSGRIPEPAPEGPGPGAHPHQLHPCSVTLCTFYPLVQPVSVGFQSERVLASLSPRLSILPDWEGAERGYQGFSGTLQCRSATFIPRVCLCDAQGAGQTLR